MFGAREAAWPLIRTEMGLTYAQIGVLLAVPAVVGHVLEPAVGVLGDVWDRRTLILGGGVLFAVSVALVAASPGSCRCWRRSASATRHPAPSSASPRRRSWTPPRRAESRTWRAGISPATWARCRARLPWVGSAKVGIGWRGLFAGLTGVSLLVLAAVWKPIGRSARRAPKPLRGAEIMRGIAEVVGSLRRLDVVRWLVLLEMSDLMLDGLLGYLALYFVDVAEASEAVAALGVGVWMVAGLVGSLLLIPMLERVAGLTYLKYSVLCQIGLFAAFLLAPALPFKLAIAALLGLSSAGWYAVLQAQVYAAMPGRSGSVLALENVSGLAGSLIPLGLGVAASRWGLGPAMWLLLAGPLAIAVGLPRRR